MKKSTPKKKKTRLQKMKYERIQGPFRDYIPRLHCPKDQVSSLPDDPEAKVPTICMLKVARKFIASSYLAVDCGHCNTVLNEVPVKVPRKAEKT